MTKEQEDFKQLQKEVSLICMHLYQIKKLIINSLIFLLLGLITGLLVINAHPVHRFQYQAAKSETSFLPCLHSIISV